MNLDRLPTRPQDPPVLNSTAAQSRIRCVLPWLVISLGILLRLAQYASNRSLWYDEANLVLNIIDRSISSLLQPLDYDQGAPIGFLLLEKLVVQSWGVNEYALRLIPLLSGVISLFLFYQAAKRYINPNAVLIALYLFAISDTLIYYSSEVKQYSSDVAITVVLLVVVRCIFLRKPTLAQSFALGAIGAIAIWFSHPAIFILAGIGISIITPLLLGRERIEYHKLFIIFALWSVSLCVNYLVHIRHLAANGAMTYYWRANNGFMPVSLQSIHDVKWFFFKLFDLFSDPGGLKLFWLELSGIAAALFFIGCYAMLGRNKNYFIVLVSPIILALAASGMELYPFSGRLLLFIVPSLFLLVAEGAAYVLSHNNYKLPIAGALLIAVMLAPSSLNAAQYLLSPRTREEIRPAIQYIQEHKQPHDALYVYQGAQSAFAYYTKMFDLEMSYVSGVDARGDWPVYINDIERLQSRKRIWFLFSHVRTVRGMDEEQFLLYHLDTRGQQIDSFSTMGANAYLYHFSGDVSGNEPP